MGMPNTFVNGTLADADEVNENFTYVDNWNDLIYSETFTYAILAHSATAWTIISSSSSKVTSDSGATFTDCSTDNADMTGVSKVCLADKTKAICCDHNYSNMFISSDSGDNWTAVTTAPPFTRVLDLSFPTATVAVCGGDYAAAPSGIYYSNDAGDTWSASDFPAADCVAIDMVDASDGLAIHSDRSIYSTADGGETWTDSGQAVGNITGQTDIIALTATTGVMLTQHTDAVIETFNTTSGGTKRFRASNGEFYSNLVKTTAGDIYFIDYTFADTNVPVNINLYRSSDSGVTWSRKALGGCLFDSEANLSYYNTHAQLIEYDTNKLLFIVGNEQLMRITV